MMVSYKQKMFQKKFVFEHKEDGPMKKKLFAGLTCAALLAMPGAAMADSTDVHLIINNAYVGSTVETGQPYINDAGRTMIPLRLVSETMGYQTDWQSDGSIHITSADNKVDVTLEVGSKNYTANGVTGNFETAPTLKNDRTYLPARDFSELYGSIYWDNDTRTVWVAQDSTVQYAAIGDKLFRANGNGIQQVGLPNGYTLYGGLDFEPLGQPRTIDGVTYLTIQCDRYDFVNPVQLFRDDGDHLTYLTDVYLSSYYVDGNMVYYTDGVNAGAWENTVEPNRLYVADLSTGQTSERTVDFVINNCNLAVSDGVLYATSPDGTVHTVAL